MNALTLMCRARAGIVALALLTAAASAAASSNGADPMAADAAVPPLEYRSSFADYHPITEPKLGDWRDANDTVHRIGGWRTYLRESRQRPSKQGAPNDHVHSHGGGR